LVSIPEAMTESAPARFVAVRELPPSVELTSIAEVDSESFDPAASRPIPYPLAVACCRDSLIALIATSPTGNRMSFPIEAFTSPEARAVASDAAIPINAPALALDRAKTAFPSFETGKLRTAAIDNCPAVMSALFAIVAITSPAAVAVAIDAPTPTPP
jgi:hypothetical protein